MKILSFVLCVAFAASGCSQSQTAEVRRSEVRRRKSDGRSHPQKAEDTKKFAALQNQIKEIAAEAKGKVGVAAIVLAGGQEADGKGQKAGGSRQEAESTKHSAT